MASQTALLPIPAAVEIYSYTNWLSTLAPTGSPDIKREGASQTDK